jgi:hypothetical protein
VHLALEQIWSRFGQNRESLRQASIYKTSTKEGVKWIKDRMLSLAQKRAQGNRTIARQILTENTNHTDT